MCQCNDFIIIVSIADFKANYVLKIPVFCDSKYVSRYSTQCVITGNDTSIANQLFLISSSVQQNYDIPNKDVMEWLSIYHACRHYIG